MRSEQELREALKQVLDMVARGVPDLDTVIRARAALAAVPMQEVPAGFVLVPVEPTADMLASLTGFDFRGDFDQRRSAMRRGAWAALLSAASRSGVNK